MPTVCDKKRRPYPPGVDDTGLSIERAIPELRTALDSGPSAVLVAPPGSGKTAVVPLRLLAACIKQRRPPLNRVQARCESRVGSSLVITGGGATVLQGTARDFDLSRFIRKTVLLGFALIHLVLISRILLDMGVIPETSGFGELIVTWSNVLAAPVQGVGSGLDSLFGGGGFTAIAGDGFDPAIVAALLGWSVVQGLVMRVVRKFDEI